MDGRVLSIALSAAVAAWCLARVAIRQPKPLASRVEPYTTVARARLGSARAELPTADAVGHSGVALVFGPLVRTLADGLARLVDATGSSSAELRLGQAGLALTIEQYRSRQLAYTGCALAVGAFLGLLLGTSTRTVILLAVASAFWGATRWRARVERLINRRCERMRAELYTVCQLIAVYLRTGDTPAGAIDRLVRRADGEVVRELTAAAAQIRSGAEPQGAFRQLTASTPEPTAARLYRLLSSSWTAGGDADALLALGEDLRSSRRENLARTMAKRQTAMALPLVMIIGPILILFVAAAIPHIVFGR